jgi:hypothetical protein
MKKTFGLIGMAAVLLAVTLGLQACDDGTISDMLSGTKYTVTIVSPLSGGTITATPESGTAGTTITLVVAPDDGYQLKSGSLKYNGIAVSETEPYQFNLPKSDATITAEFIDEDEDPVFVTSITLSKTTLSLISGIPQTIQATVEPDDATNSNILWTSSDNNVATVSGGTITVNAATATGTTATITATAADESGILATCTITAYKLESDAATEHEINKKFGISEDDEGYVAKTFAALHTYIQAAPELISSVINVGSSATDCDYIDLASLTIPANTSLTVAELSLTDEQVKSATGYYKLRMMVIGVNSFKDKNGNGTTPHIVFQFQNAITNGKMISAASTAVNSYKVAPLRTYITGDLKNALKTAGIPFDTDIIWSPKRLSYDHATTGLLTLEDQIWLPTEWEMKGSNTVANTLENGDNQVQFAGYTTATNLKKYLANTGVSATAYWSGSPGKTDTALKFCMINNGNGGIMEQAANAAVGISPAFVVR